MAEDMAEGIKEVHNALKIDVPEGADTRLEAIKNTDIEEKTLVAVKEGLKNVKEKGVNSDGEYIASLKDTRTEEGKINYAEIDVFVSQLSDPSLVQAFVAMYGPDKLIVAASVTLPKLTSDKETKEFVEKVEAAGKSDAPESAKVDKPHSECCSHEKDVRTVG